MSIGVEGDFALWIQSIWEMNSSFPLNRPHLWALLAIRLEDLYDPTEISPLDLQNFSNLVRKFIKPWRSILIESRMDSFNQYYTRTKDLLAATYRLRNWLVRSMNVCLYLDWSSNFVVTIRVCVPIVLVPGRSGCCGRLIDLLGS